ncbi:MAG: APC family permease [Rubrobacter sp.]|nr:APC family permease [Rubrobacter sp.]
MIGVVGAVAITALNYFGIRPSAIFQIIAVLFLLGVGTLLLFGIFFGGEAANFRPLFAGSFSVSVAGILAVVIATPFLFVGFDVIPQSAEEINLPYRQIGGLLILSVVMAAAWYILIIVGVGAGMSQSELESTSLATADAMGNLFGSAFFSNLLILGGVAGIMTSWNSFMVGGSRIFYAMAESGMLPAWLGRLHPRYKTPSNAILLIGGLSILAPFFGDSALGWLVNAGGLGIVVAYFLVAVSFLFLRRNEPGMERPFRAGRGPAIGIIAVVLSVGIGIQYLPYMPAGLGLPEWVIVGAWTMIGVIFLLRMDVPEYDGTK